MFEGLCKDDENVNILFFSFYKNNIQQVFQKLHSLLKEEFSNEDLQIVACPSMEQVYRKFPNLLNYFE